VDHQPAAIPIGDQKEQTLPAGIAKNHRFLLIPGNICCFASSFLPKAQKCCKKSSLPAAHRLQAAGRLPKITENHQKSRIIGNFHGRSVALTGSVAFALTIVKELGEFDR
jgi:hypothetical protein